MPKAKVGSRYAYGHPMGFGLGEHVRDEAGFGEMKTDMSELDLQDGQEVTLFALDEDSGWPIINWTDSTGIDRMTTVSPELFDRFFQSAEASS